MREFRDAARRSAQQRHRFSGLLCALCVVLYPASAAWAGGSNYNVVPGALATVKGQVTEWDVPTPKFARDPAPAPDGSMFITVMQGDRIARFDPVTRKFREWDLPTGAKPHGLLVDRQGIVFYTGNGNGTIGRLDPVTGKVTEFRTPKGGDPHTLIQAADGTIWFTEQSADRIGRLDAASGAIREYETRGSPYGLAMSKDGAIWFCQLSGHRLGRLDPATGNITEVELPRGTGPRRVAANADGSILWWAFHGSNELVKFDPIARKILKKYALPAGRGGGAYAVTVDGAGFPWVNEISDNTVVRLDPATEKMQVIKLPTPNTGIRKMIIAADGRLWYMGSHSGKIGMIE
jgi:virginiamycin B lyase